MKIRKLLKSFHYGERGFTLIELLVVVAILGVLAAVVIPNVIGFMGEGAEETESVEYHNVELAVAAMMVDAGVYELDAAYPSVNTEAQVALVLCDSGAYNLRTYLHGGEYPLKQTYAIATDGEVSVLGP